MLLPHEFAIVSLDDAEKFVKFCDNLFVDKMHSTKIRKLQEAGIDHLYEKMQSFVQAYVQWRHTLLPLNPDDFKSKSDFSD